MAQAEQEIVQIGHELPVSTDASAIDEMIAEIVMRFEALHISDHHDRDHNSSESMGGRVEKDWHKMAIEELLNYDLQLDIAKPVKSIIDLPSSPCRKQLDFTKWKAGTGIAPDYPRNNITRYSGHRLVEMRKLFIAGALGSAAAHDDHGYSSEDTSSSPGHGSVDQMNSNGAGTSSDKNKLQRHSNNGIGSSPSRSQLDQIKWDFGTMTGFADTAKKITSSVGHGTFGAETTKSDTDKTISISVGHESFGIETTNSDTDKKITSSVGHGTFDTGITNSADRKYVMLKNPSVYGFNKY